MRGFAYVIIIVEMSLPDLVKALFIPGSTFFLLLVSSAALLLGARRRLRTLATAALAATVVGYWALSLPAVCDWVGGTLPRYLLVRPDPATPARAIVVLSAGVSRYDDGNGDVIVAMEQSALNALEGARLHKLHGLPVIAAGGSNDPGVEQAESVAIRKILIEHGVPTDRILEESASRTTREQALGVAQMVSARGWQPVLLVTAPVHLLRARATFAAAGVDVISAPASFHSAHWVFRQRWTPALEALKSSHDSMYDYIGWVYYWAHGWLTRGPRSQPSLRFARASADAKDSAHTTRETTPLPATAGVSHW
jgi:uncharacterized SAM-binding protein YcdF (DUF218 family)